MDVSALKLSIEATTQAGRYLQAKLAQQLSGKYYQVSFPPEWDFDFLSDCNRAVTVIAHAIKHKGALVNPGYL